MANVMDKAVSNSEILEKRKKYFIPTAVTYYKEPLQLVSAQGSEVFDEKGNAYLDCIGGIVCISAGHNHPKIKERIKEMLDADEIQHTSLLYLNHWVTDLAEKLVAEAPKGVTRAAFTNSGSEANELALMTARNATGEGMVMHLRHGYHGGTSGTLANCGHYTWRFASQPVTNVTSVEPPYCYRCPFGKTANNCEYECAQAVEKTIQTTTHGKLAAFICEPVMGVGGFITPKKEYFDLVADIIHKYGGKYISDEVQTGAGRCGENFLLTKSLGIKADMVTMAKGFGNGAAIGAVLMTDEVAAPLAGKLWFNTFGGDPYQTMQALTTMEIIEEEKLVENAKLMGERLTAGLNELAKKHEIIGDVRGRGLLMGVELVKDRKTKEYATAECAELMERCKAKGLLIGKGGLFGNVVRLAPPISINAEQIDRVLKVLDESLGEIK